MPTQVAPLSELSSLQLGSHEPRIAELDGLRGTAALMVFFHHVLYTSTLSLEQWKQPILLFVSICQVGAYGVDLFFVLSGYLITSILLNDRTRPHYYWNFYWRRALRILPLYGAILVWLATVYPPTRKYVLLSVLFLANFEHVFHVGAYGPFWTLAIEEQFYLFWPQALRRISLKNVERMALAIAGVCLVLRLADSSIGHHNYRFTFFHCDGLALGAVLACQLKSLRSKPVGEQRSSASELRLMLMVAISGVVLAGMSSFFPAVSGMGLALGAFRLTGVSLVAYCAVRVTVQFTGAGWLGFLRSRVLVFFGLISYAMYMVHEYMMGFYQRYFGIVQVGDVKGLVLRFLLILGATTTIAVTSRYLLELPAMSLRRYVLRKS
jgi:peptidoglycan/LPS O-acetylase OafA/YrhL